MDGFNDGIRFALEIDNAAEVTPRRLEKMPGALCDGFRQLNKKRCELLIVRGAEQRPKRSLFWFHANALACFTR